MKNSVFKAETENNVFKSETKSTVFKSEFGKLNIETGDGIYSKTKRVFNIGDKITINDIINFIKGLPWKYDGKRS